MIPDVLVADENRVISRIDWTPAKFLQDKINDNFLGLVIVYQFYVDNHQLKVTWK